MAKHRNNKRAKVASYSGCPTALDIRFTGVRAGGDSVEIHVDSTPRRLQASPVVIGKKVLRGIGESLVSGLERYCDEDTFASLKALAEMGYEAFETLASKLGPNQVDRWKRLLDAPKDVSHAVIRIEFESDLSFPACLLCTSEPDTNNYKILVDKFVGTRSVVINTLGLIDGRQDDITFVAKRYPCIVAHAIDEDVPGADQESKYLASLKGVRSERCLNRTELLKSWNNTDTAVVHFSSHHRYDRDMEQYVLTLSNGEVFRALTDLKKLTRAYRGLPFLFMNGCNTGTIFEGAPDTFVRSLCPTYSAGILSTIHSVGGEDAARFAKKYYENWLAGGFAVDALARTKHSFIYGNKDFSAITYEFWEMPEVLRLFEEQEDEIEERDY